MTKKDIFDEFSKKYNTYVIFNGEQYVLKLDDKNIYADSSENLMYYMLGYDTRNCKELKEEIEFLKKQNKENVERYELLISELEDKYTKKDKNNKIFAYGTLKDNFKNKKEAYIDGYVLDSTDMFPNIVPSEGSQVKGYLVEVSDEELKKCDRYEGYPEYYNREEKEVYVNNEIKTKAWVYFKND